MIEIWGKANCPQCDTAKKLCETKGINYVYKKLDIDFTREEVLAEFPGARTFPQIKASDKVLGGLKQLEEHLEHTN